LTVFEGLPENWSSSYDKGSFSVEGNLPISKTKRGRFFKRWFENTGSVAKLMEK
jgi:hypothetical protein